MKKIEIFFRKLLLNILLSFRFRSKSTPDNYQDKETKILFIRLNRIGDALIATSLIHEIRKRVKSQIFMLADKKNYFVFANNKDIDRLFVFQKGFLGMLNVLRLIKKNNINTIVDLHDDVSATVSFLVAFSKASNKFTLEKESKKIYSRTIPKLEPSAHHVITRLMEIEKLFNILPSNDVNIHYAPKKTSIEMTIKYLNDNLPKRKFLIGVNISAGSDARFWGIENYKKLFSFISAYDVLLICSPNDRELAEKISDGEIKLFYSNNFDEFAAMISQLNLLISPDTAAVHLASAFEIPVFGLYVKYKTNDMIWSPFRSKFEYIVTEEPTLKNVTFENVKLKLEPFITRLFHNE